MKGYQYKYQVALWWSDADKAFIAMVPEVPGCIIDGPTPEAALSNLNEVVEICLDYRREENLPLPRPVGHLLPVQSETDWKDMPDEFFAENTDGRQIKTPVAAPRRKRQPVPKEKVARKRSTHVTTKNTV